MHKIRVAEGNLSREVHEEVNMGDKHMANGNLEHLILSKKNCTGWS